MRPKSSRAAKSKLPRYTKVETPRFASEQEEAEWWDSHPEVIDDAIERAEAAGAVTEESDAGATKPTNIRLSVADVTAAKAIAARKGLKLQTYIKMVFHEAVERDRAAYRSRQRRA